MIDSKTTFEKAFKDISTIGNAIRKYFPEEYYLTHKETDNE